MAVVFRGGRFQAGHRLAHYVSGGVIVALPDEDHNPETQASLSAVLGGRPDIPAEQRMEVSLLIEDFTVSHQAGWYSVISLHGGIHKHLRRIPAHDSR
jgi:4-hydroxybutyryl-CoA dehydratase/vinylacetyl-CoA-Delta-isomerase